MALRRGLFQDALPSNKAPEPYPLVRAIVALQQPTGAPTLHVLGPERFPCRVVFTGFHPRLLFPWVAGLSKAGSQFEMRGQIGAYSTDANLFRMACIWHAR